MKIHFQLAHAQPFDHVSGSVVGLTPGSGFSVWLASPDGQRDYCWCFPNPPDPKGHFEMSVPSGSYNAHADMRTGAGLRGVAVRRVNVSGNTTGLLLRIEPLLTVPVHVQPDSQLITSIDLIRMSGSIAGQGFPVSFGPPVGPYEIPNLEPGTYRAVIKVRAPWYWYLASARSGNTNLLAEDLTVRADAPVQPIEIALRHDVATIDGNVSSDGRPTSGVVLLIPRFSPRRAITISVGLTGEFQMVNLPPGEYSAYALNHTDELEYANPEAMSEYEPGKKIIRVPPNGHVSVTLELQKSKP